MKDIDIRLNALVTWFKLFSFLDYTPAATRSGPVTESILNGDYQQAWQRFKSNLEWLGTQPGMKTIINTLINFGIIELIVKIFSEILGVPRSIKIGKIRIGA